MSRTAVLIAGVLVGLAVICLIIAMMSYAAP